MKDGVAVKINRTAYDAGRSNWVSGSHDGYTFEAEVFAEPSVFGIPTPRFEDGGNVSELLIRDAEGREVYGYNRWLRYGETVPHYADVANEIVAALEAEFCEEA